MTPKEQSTNDDIADSTRVSMSTSDDNPSTGLPRPNAPEEEYLFSPENSDKQTKAASLDHKELPSFGPMYDTLEIIGMGGMSIVYKIRHKLIGKNHAAKMLHLHLVDDPSQEKRFRAEAKALFSLQHPSIVAVKEFAFTDDGKPFLLMDFLEGQPLSAELKNGPIGVTRSLKLLIQTCDALEHAHSKGIIHRDLKPSNMVVTKDEKGDELLKILDFGIAKLGLDSTGNTIAALTTTGEVFGSPPYMSPEQCNGTQLDTRSDIYSLGCVMYEMLSGKPPFKGETPLAILHKHSTQLADPLSIKDCDLRLQQRFDEIVFKTLEKHPDNRYQSMRALKTDLLEILESTAWTKRTGTYLKYTRAQRRLEQSAKAHPIIFAAIAAISAGVISFSFFACNFWEAKVRLMRNLPLTTFRQLDWKYEQLKVEPTPIDFEHRFNLAKAIIVRHKLKEGDNAPLVLGQEFDLARYCMKFGMWNHAIEFFENVVRGYLHSLETYGSNDVRLALCYSALGDCFAARNNQGDIGHAFDFYSRALEIYENSQNDGFTQSTDVSAVRAKLARLLAKQGQIEAAINEYSTVIALASKNNDQTNENKIPSGVREGLGDCELALCSTGRLARNSFLASLKRARNEYALVLLRKKTAPNKTYDDYDSVIAKLRIIDTYSINRDYSRALSGYEAIRNNLQQLWDGFTPSQRDTISRFRAQLLWNTGHYLESFDAVPDEKHAAEP